jgi:hypothetical protein
MTDCGGMCCGSVDPNIQESRGPCDYCFCEGLDVRYLALECISGTQTAQNHHHMMIQTYEGPSSGKLTKSQIPDVMQMELSHH